MERNSAGPKSLAARLGVTLRWAALIALFLLHAGCPRPVPPPLPPPTPFPATPMPTPVPTPVPTPTPPPTPYVPNKRVDVGKIFNGMQLRTTLQTDFGGETTETRDEPGSYGVDVQVHVKVPKPHRDLAQLSKLNSLLPQALPQLSTLLGTAKVSPAFDELYRLKVASLQQSLMHLDGTLSRHNFYDCETLLELEAPATKRRALLLQADMDTDDDGSDSDRVPEVDGGSVTFQPFTSYKWPKKTTQPNSFINPRLTRLRQLEIDLQIPGVSAGRLEQMRAQRAALRTEISDLQKYSYLVGSADPYVVLPSSMFGRKLGAFAPAVGDYCVVIYNDQLLPAIVGDVGPNDLVGEASLRICREIEPRADANNRPVNDLKATYLIFPGSADRPFEAPNLEKWRTRCDALLKDLGGYEGKLTEWQDLTKPLVPPPAPQTPGNATPAPAPGATPAPGSPATPVAAPAHPQAIQLSPATLPSRGATPKPGTPKPPAPMTPAATLSTPAPATPKPTTSSPSAQPATPPTPAAPPAQPPPPPAANAP